MRSKIQNELGNTRLAHFCETVGSRRHVLRVLRAGPVVSSWTGRVKIQMELFEAGALIEGGLGELAGITGTAGTLAYGLTHLTGTDPYDFRNAMETPRGVRALNRSRRRSKSRSRSNRSTSSARRAAGGTVITPGRTRVGPTMMTKFYHGLGIRPGSQGVKKSTREIPKGIGFKDKELHFITLVDIPYSDVDDLRNTREHRIVNVRSVKIRKWFSFKPGILVVKPITVRWAILNPRDNSGAGATDIAPGTDFFMSPDPGADPAENFPATGNVFQYMNRAINRRRYGVLKEGHFQLTPDPANNAVPTVADSTYQKFLSIYVPIRRQMKWPNNTTSSPNANLYFVWWYTSTGDMESAQQYTSDPSVPLQTISEVTTYFKTTAAFT